MANKEGKEKLNITTNMEVEASPAGTTSTEISGDEVVECPVDNTTPELKGGESSSATNPEGQTLQRLGSGLNRLDLNKKKLSGAQKRKRAIERAKAKGEPIKPRKPRNNRKPQTAENPGIDLPSAGKPGASQNPDPVLERNKGQKRIRSDGSTPSPASNRQKMAKRDSAAAKPSHAGASYSKVTSQIKMSVIPGDYPESRLTEEQGSLIQAAIIQEIWKCQPGRGPKFNHSQMEQGMVVIHCANEEAMAWLQETTLQLKPWEGAQLKAIPTKEVAPRVRVSVWIPKGLLDAEQPAKLLGHLKTQNEGIDPEGWRIFDVGTEPKGSRLIIGMDQNSLKVLAKRDFKLYLGLTMLTFRVMDPKSKNVAGNTDKPAT